MSRIAEDIVATYANVNRALQAFESEKARAETDESRLPALRQRDEEVATVLDRFQGLIEEVEALGGGQVEGDGDGVDLRSGAAEEIRGALEMMPAFAGVLSIEQLESTVEVPEPT